MAIRNIVLEGDPGLLKPSRTITDFGPRIHTLLDDMRETLIQAQGAGLAAPQVGVLRRAAIVLVEDAENEIVEYLEILNPEIIATEGEVEDWEGCLSVPGKRGRVTRPAKVTVRAQDRHGNWFEHTAEGYEARGFCHEIDHLAGKLYIELTDELFDSDNLPEDDD